MSPTRCAWGDGFEVETLINVRVAKAGLKIEEVPSFESVRIHGTSNLNAVSDGLRVLKTIATERRVGRKAAPHRSLVAPVIDFTQDELKTLDLRDVDLRDASVQQAAS